MKVAIDRIESGIAVLISRDDPQIRFTVPVSVLPPGCKEGDILTLSLERDETATTAAKERVTSLIDKLKKKK
jgi:hypothetical protein